MRRWVGGIALAAAAGFSFRVPAFGADTSAAISSETARAATELRDRALSGTRAAQWVASLTDRAGPRLAGSPGDRAAVEWGLETLREAGFSNVHSERVEVSVWSRASESAEVESPWPMKLAVTALGGSVPTPPDGVAAEVLRVTTLEELDAKGAEARGKIVFFDKKMERSRDFSGYRGAVDVRAKGPSRAAKYGALAVLIRSVGTDSNRLPHTGGLDYDEAQPRLPAAALSIPDADVLARLLRRDQPVRVRLKLSCGPKGTAESANVVAEIPGGSRPSEIVLLGAHLDSWDLGNGAIDDGAGCGIVIEAGRLILRASRRPARTVRIVLFANEENGLAGGRTYAKAHAAELARHSAALEADSGSGRPIALSWLAGPTAEPLVRRIATLLQQTGAGKASGDGNGGADISPLRAGGVPLFAVEQDVSTYFDFHHTANDTFDKIEPEGLDRMVAAVAAFAYVAADAPALIERIPEAKRPTPKW